MKLAWLRLLYLLKVIAKPRLYERGHLILLAVILLTLCLFRPQAQLPNRVYDWLVVIDITQSMNVRDYNLNDQGISRLEYAKLTMRNSLRALPCGSHVALGLFTERNTLNIVRPVEVCAHYSSLDQTISRLDWRMAWAADSFIAHGVYSAIEQATKLGKHMRVLMITDGNQAPPANPKYMPSFTGKAGEVKGYLVGSGQLSPSPIPKLDDRGEVEGYWDSEEVLRYGSFGMAETLSVLAMEQGQHDRNAGHGAGASLLSNAHLSGLDEPALKKLAKQTGLGYIKLDNMAQIEAVLTDKQMATRRWANTDLRPWLAIPALLLGLVYVLSAFELSAWLHAYTSTLRTQAKALFQSYVPKIFRNPLMSHKEKT